MYLHDLYPDNKYLYIELTISFLHGRKHTVNSWNQRPIDTI